MNTMILILFLGALLFAATLIGGRQIAHAGAKVMRHPPKLPVYRDDTAYERAAYHEAWLPKVRRCARLCEGWDAWKARQKARRMSANYRDARRIIAAYEARQSTESTEPTGFSSFDDGSYNCGLQFADGWMSRYPIVCGDSASQIAAAEAIARASSGDPWPNCPDPYDGSGGSWQDTVNCENGGRW